VTAYWVALGFSGVVFALALLFSFWPLDPDKFNERQFREYRLTLEGRKAPWGHVFIVSLGLMWLIFAVEEISSGSPTGFAYLIPAILFLTSIWLYRRNRIKELHKLGDRGFVPRTAVEERAEVWYRLWGAIAVVGWVGPSIMEFNYQRSFETADPFKDGASIVHFLLSLCLIIGATGLLITYLNARGQRNKEGDSGMQP
jgi:hypothetical protein